MKQGELFGESERSGRLDPGTAGRKTRSATRGGDASSEANGTPGDGTPGDGSPGDGAARRAAVGLFDRPLLLEAGAGTGKTATLVARVVHWCLGPGWEEAAADLPAPEPEAVAPRVLRRVAAITFSEAAAAEMSTRVGQALARLKRVSAGVDGELPADALAPGMSAAVLPDEARVVHERARALRATLDQLDVSTIHAFCRRLLAAHPLYVGFDPAFRVDPTFTQLEICVRDVLEEHLREAWTEPVDEDLVELARHGVDPRMLEQALVALVAEHSARAADFARDPFDDQTCRALREELAAVLDRFRAVAVPFAAGSGNTALAAEAVERTAHDLADLPAGGDARAMLAGLCSRLKSTWKVDERGWDRLKNWGKGKLTKGEAKLIGAAAADLEARALELRGALEPFFELSPELLACGRRVVGRVLERVEAELRRRGIATFSDLLVEARRLLREQPEIAARERERRRQLLVDEFQDTDAVQCDIVSALAFDESGAPGKTTVFLVGDPKQSIYAWRNADLAAYEDIAARVVAAGGERLALTRNFRSVSAVLNEVDRSLRPVMRAVESVQPAFVPLEAVREAAGGGAAIEFWVSWPRDEDGRCSARLQGRVHASYAAEGRAFAADVAARHARGECAWKDCALVLRGFTDLDPYLEELRRRGIPYEVQSDRTYYRRREVIDATALVRTVLDPADQVALVTLLRSPLVGVPDAALLPLWETGLPGKLATLTRPADDRLAELEECARAAAARVPRSVPGLAEIEGWETGLVAALRAVATLRRSFQQDSIDRWLERLRALFLPDVLEAARFLGEYRLANVDRFFRDLQRALEERSGDVHSVLRTLRSNLARDDRSEISRPSDSARDAIQVLTIHGAKGLEFRHVYLAQAHKQHRNRKEPPTAFDRRGEDVAYRLFDSPAPSWFAARRRRQEAEAAERVRLLYVALTRAADRLVVLGAWPEDLTRRRPWQRAVSILDLLQHRHGAEAALAEIGRRASGGEEEPVVDEHGATWRLTETLDGGGGADAADDARVARDASRAAVEVRALDAARAAAAEHQRRPYHGRASEEGHTEGAERRASVRFAEADEVRTAPPVGRDTARAIGTAVHHVLEHLDLDADYEESAWRGELERVLAVFVREEDRERALERALDLLRRASDNGLLARLAGLRDHVLARELPVLLRPGTRPEGEEGPPPVGFVAGAIDLLYRDPESGELVVADYKTDAVGTDDDVAARAESYRAQGGLYADAVRAALDTDERPRFELWFLYAGSVVAADR